MAKILFWSDLHCEFRGFDLPALSDLAAPPDVLLLAGDTATQGAHIDFALQAERAYGCPVLLVDGNHELYGQNKDDFEVACDARIRDLRTAGHDIDILRGQSRVIKDTRIIGATLWTDYDRTSAFHEMNKVQGARRMADYRRIRIGSDDRPLTPEDTIGFHDADLDRILAELAMPFEGPTVVFTHHLPAVELIAPEFQGDPLNGAFASNLMARLDPLVFDTWIYGHSHLGREISTGDENPHRFLANMRGYPGEVTSFDPTRMVMTGADAPEAPTLV